MRQTQQQKKEDAVKKQKITESKKEIKTKIKEVLLKVGEVYKENYHYLKERELINSLYAEKRALQNKLTFYDD